MHVSLLLYVVSFAGCTVGALLVSESKKQTAPNVLLPKQLLESATNGTPKLRGGTHCGNNSYPDGNGICVEYCKVGTHAYSPGCGPITPEATCDNPNPQSNNGVVCDYNACYCDSPTVRSRSGACIPLSECVEPKNKTVSVATA